MSGPSQPESPQPEYVWAYGPPRRSAGRAWLIAGLAVLAVAIAVAVFLFLQKGPSAPQTSPSPSASTSAPTTPSPSASPTATESATPTPTPTPTATESEQPTPPPSADPDLAAFRSAVSPVLDDAETGLRYAREDGGMSAMENISLLQQDAARLSDRAAPSSIAAQWRDAVRAYARALEPLRAAYESGADASDEDAAAAESLRRLNAVIGR